MTIEELLKLSTADLEAMSDQQIEEHFAPLLEISRPKEPRPEPVKKSRKKKDIGGVLEELEAAVRASKI